MKMVLLAIVFLVLTAGDIPADPYQYDIAVQAGEDFTLDVYFTSESGALLDLSADSFAAQCRTDYATQAAFCNFSAIKAAPGLVRLKLSHAATASAANRRGVWDLRQTTLGLVRYIMRGVIKFVPTVTR